MATAKLVCLDDYELAAKDRLTKMVYDYYRSGADREMTLNRTRKAFDRLIIRPRMLRNVRTRILSQSFRLKDRDFRMEYPIGIAATATQCMAHPDGELATVRAAAAVNTIMILSTISSKTIEQVAQAGPGVDLWFQMYMCKDRNLTLQLLKRVENAGFSAVVVTVDTPTPGTRRNDLRNGFNLSPGVEYANFKEYIPGDSFADNKSGESFFSKFVSTLFDPGLTWDDVAWLKQMTSLPVMVKGLLTYEDALEAKMVANGIIVSNHGARQLDSCPATIEALPEIMRAVGGEHEIPVFLDGGVRTGTDVFKALALGAKAVFVGRPIVWALAVDGQNGVEAMMRTLRNELDTAMSLAGCRSVGEIQHSEGEGQSPRVVLRSFYDETFRIYFKAKM